MKKELINIVIDNEAAGNYWANDLMYKGSNLFDIYIENSDDFSDELEIGKKMERNNYSYSDEEEEEYENYEPLSGQEVYLGYIVSTDTFISAFDLWDNGGSGSGMVSFKIINGKVKIVGVDFNWGFLFYHDRGGFKRLHTKFKDLVDIRLD